MSCLLLFYSKGKLKFVLHIEIRSMVRTLEAPQRDIVKHIEKKLEKCRNQENNPDSLM